MLHLPTNSSKIAIQNYIDKFSDKYQKSLEQLSSGNKYTSVNENPVEYCKSSRLQYEIQSNKGLLSNIELGNDLLTIASGAEESVSDNLLRIRDLCLQAASETYSDSDKDKILDEVRARLEDINFTASEVSFNGKTLLDSSAQPIQIQLSTKAGNSINLTEALTNVKTSVLDVDIDDTVTGATWTTDDIYDYIDNIDAAIDVVDASVTKIGNYSDKLDNSYKNITSTIENVTQLRSVVMDTDTAAVCTDEVKYQILQQTSVNILAQSNQITDSVLSLLSF